MRVDSTRVAQTIALRHRCIFHGSRRQLLTQLTTLVERTVASGTTVALSVSPETAAAVAHTVGRSERLVALSEPGTAGHSGQTLAARRALELRELSRSNGHLAMVNEHLSDLDGPDGSFWTELDAAFNIALADLDVELTCFYPELPLYREITEGAWLNHPEVLADGGGFRPNPSYHKCPREVLERHPAPQPPLLGAPDLELAFGAWQLNEVRAAVEAALLRAGYGRSRAEDIVLAVNEIATNAVEYGSTGASLQLWLEPYGAVFEVHDRGTLRDPLPGLQVPHSSEPRGRGVWIARQVCEALHVWADNKGTHVRLHAGCPV